MTIADMLRPETKKRKPLANGAFVASAPASRDFKARAEIVAAVAARHASSVDSEARFPAEAIAAAREQRLLGIMVPRELGGEGASISEIADVCYRLGRACSSTAMIYAMHQTKVACLVRHTHGSAWHERLLRRLASEELLFASSTTEGQGGGNVRSSQAPIEFSDGRIYLERKATVISYGAQADAVVTTARRSGDASSADQVLVAFLKEDYTLEPQLSWDTLGMRGTCSAGFLLKARGEDAQILPDPYERIHVESMAPGSQSVFAKRGSILPPASCKRKRAMRVPVSIVVRMNRASNMMAK